MTDFHEKAQPSILAAFINNFKYLNLVFLIRQGLDPVSFNWEKK
jgi:hypothetical protein